MNNLPDNLLQLILLDSDLEHELGRDGDRTQVSITTVQLQSHTSFYKTPQFILVSQDLRRSARSFTHTGSQPSLVLALPLDSKIAAPDCVLRVRICTAER